MSVAAPLVIAHRLARMAAAGPTPEARDRAEFRRMVDEKTVAFSHGWTAMAVQTMRAQQSFAQTALRSLAFPWLASPKTAAALLASWRSAAAGIVEKGMIPVHRKAVANARRLGRRTRKR